MQIYSCIYSCMMLYGCTPWHVPFFLWMYTCVDFISMFAHPWISPLYIYICIYIYFCGVYTLLDLWSRGSTSLLVQALRMWGLQLVQSCAIRSTKSKSSCSELIKYLCHGCSTPWAVLCLSLNNSAATASWVNHFGIVHRQVTECEGQQLDLFRRIWNIRNWI